MFSNLPFWRWNESSEISSSSAIVHRQEAKPIVIDGRDDKTMLTRTQESSEISSSSAIVYRQEEKPIVIDGRDDIYSVAFLVDGKHVVGGDDKGKIRRWRVEDGQEVGTAMDAGSFVLNIEVSRDGKWIVGGTGGGQVTVWNAETWHSKVTEFQAHSRGVRAVDVSPDSTKIATGSDDKTSCVWSLSTGKKLLGPWKHENAVVAAKFSPDGCLIATATDCSSVRVYDSRNGSLLVEFPVKVNSWLNQSLAWASDSKQLFALSHDGYIHHVNVSAKTTLSKWRIHTTNLDPTCIALASNGTFVATSGDSSVSLWDTTTHKQIGAVITYTHRIWSMSISSSYDLVTSGDKSVSLRILCGFLPSHYTSACRRSSTRQPKKLTTAQVHESMTNLKQTIQELRSQPAESQQARQERDALIQSLRAQEDGSRSEIARLEKTNQELRDRLAESQRAANQERDDLNETINSLRTDLRTHDNSSSVLRIQLADAQRRLKRTMQEQAKSQRAADQEKGDLNETINSLRADLCTRDNSSSVLRIQLADAQRHLERTKQEQAESQCAADREKDDLNETINSLRADLCTRDNSSSVLCIQLADAQRLLEKTMQEQAESQRAADQEKEDLNETINSLRGDLCTRDNSSSALRIQLADAQHKADGINHALEQMYQCESFYAHGRIQGAVEYLLEFANVAHEDVRTNKFIIDWLTEFTHRCIAALEIVGDEASNADKWDEAITAYSTALSLGPTIPNTMMFKWANMALKRGSAREASSTATKFKVPRFIVYRVICNSLERDGRLVEAVECFQQMQSELPEDAGVRDEREKWELDFKARCMKALEKNGDVAMDSASYEDAVTHYSTALFLDPLSAVLLTKQSKARDGLLQDANAAIKRRRRSKMERWAGW
ncbi:WD40-repeat-containing domain protein [Boletus coccyginus]|nr:WD40-repeat-containing domain protein [Boletus coccyginus]